MTRGVELSQLRARRLALAALLALASNVGMPNRADGQHRGTTVLVRVGDATDGAFLPSALVRIPARNVFARTDSFGEARLPGVPAGTHQIEVFRLGYAPLAIEAAVSGRDSTEIVFLLHRAAAELPEVTVGEDWVPPRLREFELRRRSHVGGYFITADEIDRYPGLSLDALFRRRIPGVMLVTTVAGTYAYSSRGGNSLSAMCQVPAYLNGHRLWNGDISVLAPEWIGGIEYHPPGFVPVQYRDPGMRSPSSAGTVSQEVRGGPRRAGCFCCGASRSLAPARVHGGRDCDRGHASYTGGRRALTGRCVKASAIR